MKHYIKEGLSQEEVSKRVEAGQVNHYQETRTKSYGEIIRDNVFTLFMLINIVLAVLVIYTGSYRNLLFMGVVVSNLFIGIFQEIRAKRELDKLSLLVKAKVKVLREAQEVLLPDEEVVLDDIVLLESGDQILLDAVIIEGEIEVNESAITGEAEMVDKKRGDMIYSSSYVVSGNASAEVIHVGADNYAAKLSQQAKQFRRHPSELRSALNKILKVVSIVIIPIGSLLFMKQYFISGLNVKEAILQTVAGVLGMIPEGLVLLTSVALAVSVVNLGRKKVLVQELYCIETLARVDVLCFDKTGTLTEGKMKLEEELSFANEDISVIIGNLLANLQDRNSTIMALREVYSARNDWKAEKVIPFSSRYKYSGVEFAEVTYLLGGYDILLEEEVEEIKKRSSQGKRCIVLVEDKNGERKLLACLVIGDVLRKDIKETIAYFYRQGVDLKVISGDHPLTVSAVSKQAGIENSDSVLDCSQLAEDYDFLDSVKKYTIFARVRPGQKKEIIQALKKHQHTVAMTGDGVNDVLALKEADCSIAMMAGSDASKNIANLVLLENQFEALPSVVKEGRRVINNIQRTSSLFLVKTIFSTVLSVLSLLLTEEYFYFPIQLTLISSLTIGIPAFFLSLEINEERVRKNFMREVLLNALPGALCVVVIIMIISLLEKFQLVNQSQVSTYCTILTAVSGFFVLLKLTYPWTQKRTLLLIVLLTVFVVILTIFPNFFLLEPLKISGWLIVLVCGLLIPFLNLLFTNLIHRIKKSS